MVGLVEGAGTGADPTIGVGAGPVISDGAEIGDGAILGTGEVKPPLIFGKNEMRESNISWCCR